MRPPVPTRLLLLTAALLALSGCPSTPADDDDATATDDDTSADDDTTPDAPFLAPFFGQFTLIHLADGDGAYVDLSGGFRDFADLDLELLSVGGYLGGFGAYEEYWRYDLGGFPIPPVGESRFDNLAELVTFEPAQTTWWDGGMAVAIGSWQANRADLAPLLAYAVDDPLQPGGAAWTAAGSFDLDIAGGSDVVAASFPGAVTLPAPMVLLSPPTGTLETPRSSDISVSWTPQQDGATVTVTLLQGLGPVWTASVADADGTFTVPSSAIHEHFDAGAATLIVGRGLEQLIEGEQGGLLLRTREERRVDVVLLEDLHLAPGWAVVGWSGAIAAAVWSPTIGALTAVDLGAGVVVTELQAGPDPQHWTLQVTVAADAPVGPRDVVLTGTAGSVTLPESFQVLDLAPEDSCAGALTPLEDGVWHGTTAGLTHDLGGEVPCVDWTFDGPDVVYRLDLEADEQLSVNLVPMAGVDPVIYLLSDCEDGTSTLICADDGYEGDAESFAWTAAEAGTVYLVIDGYRTRDEGPFVLTLERSAP